MDGLDCTDSPSSKENTSDPQSAKLRQRFCIVDGIIDAHQAVPAARVPQVIQTSWTMTSYWKPW